VNPPQGSLIHTGIALIQQALAVGFLGRAEGRSAVTDIVFGTGQHCDRVGQVVSLQPFDSGQTEFADQLGIFRKTFVGAAPAFILRYGDAGGKGPVDAGGPDFNGSDAGDFFNQFRIACAAQADIVGEYHRADYVVVAMDAVDAVQQGDFQAGFQSVLLAVIIDIGPCLQAVAFLGVGTAAAENRADKIGLDIRYLFEAG